MKKKLALITGITGQDGSYLADFLMQKGYLVHGIKRRASSFNTDRIDYLYEDAHEKERNLILHYGELSDSLGLTRIIEETKPDEIYNLGSQSHVQVSFETPEYTADINALGTLRILEAIRFLKLEKKTKFYQASTSELYGLVQETPQSETTPFYPRSPYAVAKLYAYWMTRNYREAYQIFASNGILFNHESPRRGEIFVTRKITMAVCKIVFGLQDKLYLGNLNAKRDWGHAKDYIRSMWLILQHKKPGDWVIATGKNSTVRDFVRLAFGYFGVTLAFSGKGKNEVGRIAKVSSNRLKEREIHPTQSKHLKVGTELVKVDPDYFRPTEVDVLLGDSRKAEKELGWKSEYSLEEIVNDMLEKDFKIFKRDSLVKEMGFSPFDYDKENLNKKDKKEPAKKDRKKT